MNLNNLKYCHHIVLYINLGLVGPEMRESEQQRREREEEEQSICTYNNSKLKEEKFISSVRIHYKPPNFFCLRLGGS